MASSAAVRILAVLIIGVFVAIVLATNAFRPAPAAERLAGVTVAVAAYTIEPHRVTATSCT